MGNNRESAIELTQKDHIIHVIKFTVFSVSAGGIQVGAFALLNELTTMSERWAYLVALTLSVLWNFTLNRKFTFKSAADIPIAMIKVALFYVIFTPVSTWWVGTLTKSGINEYFVVAGTMITNFITEFIYTKYFVYRNQINTALESMK